MDSKKISERPEDVTEAVLEGARGADFAGKVVVVTGASGRIGRPLALALRRRGARLALCARRQGPIKALAKSLGSPAEYYAVSCDVSSPSQTRRFLEAVRRRFGRIDVLINNAGIRGRKSPLGGDVADWRKVLETNLTGSYLMARGAAPYMRGPDGGVIVNVSSGAGRVPEPGWGAYTVSKFGLEGLTRLIAAEAPGKGLRAYSLDPCTLRGRPARLPLEMEAAFLYLAGAAAREDNGARYGLAETEFLGEPAGSRRFRIVRYRSP